MITMQDIKIEEVNPGRMDRGMEIDGRVHCKITPYLIYAQAYNGCYEISCNGENVKLDPGEAFLTPPETCMRIVHHADPASGRMSARWVHFNVSILGVGIASLYDFPLRVQADICDKIAPDVETLLAIENDKSIAAQIEKQGVFCLILQQLLGIAACNPDLSGLFASSNRVKTASNFVRRNLDRKITVDDLADVCGLSASSLFRYFSSTLKITPQKYIMKLKMEHAAALLRGSDRPLAEIAEATGFANQFHFSRCFKQYYGTTPSSYRNSNIWDFSSF